MSIVIVRDNKTYQSWYSQVGGSNSYRDGYPFDNCTQYRARQWLEWRSGYSDQNVHTINVMTDAASCNGMALIGCNFTTAVIDGTTRTLYYNRATGDYRALWAVTMLQAETWTIPAQTTVEGYFKIKAVILGDLVTFNEMKVSYPLEYEIDQMVPEANLYGGRKLKGTEGDRKTIVRLSGSSLTTSTVNSFLQFMQNCSRDDAIVITENNLSADQTFYCRRTNDLELNEQYVRFYKNSITLREL